MSSTEIEQLANTLLSSRIAATTLDARRLAQNMLSANESNPTTQRTAISNFTPSQTPANPKTLSMEVPQHKEEPSIDVMEQLQSRISSQNQEIEGLKNEIATIKAALQNIDTTIAQVSTNLTTITQATQQAPEAPQPQVLEQPQEPVEQVASPQITQEIPAQVVEESPQDSLFVVDDSDFISQKPQPEKTESTSSTEPAIDLSNMFYSGK